MKEARLQTLKSEFNALRMKEEDSVDAYAGKLAISVVHWMMQRW